MYYHGVPVQSGLEQGVNLPNQIKLEKPYGRAFDDPIVVAGHLEARE